MKLAHDKETPDTQTLAMVALHRIEPMEGNVAGNNATNGVAMGD